MKKALSILLVAAAIFGFYGSAVTVNDLLACKDYWEEAGEKSTADMNKLEDGLNQLKDNEQAYLDGVDQIAEGEKTLAEGEAAYAAAPGQLAAGEKALAEGEQSYSQLKTLIAGLQTAKKHGVNKTKTHDTYWHDGFTFDTFKDNGKAGLKPGRKYIVATIAGMPTEVALIEGLAGLPDGTIAGLLPADGSYKKFDTGCLNVVKILTPVEAGMASYIKGAESGSKAAAGVVSVTGEDGNPTDAAKWMQYATGLQSAAKALSGESAAGVNGVIGSMKTKKTIPGVGELEKTTDEWIQMGVAGTPFAGMVTSWSSLLSVAASNAQYAGALASTIQGILDSAVTTLNGYDKTLNTVIDTLNAWDDGYNTLADGQQTLGSTSEGIPYAFKNMVTNPTIKAAIKKYDPSLMKILKKYTGTRLKSEGMDAFDSDITYLGKKVIPRALDVLSKVKSSASQQLADGRAQLAEGRASYAAAPGQLAEGRQALADGKAQLAQYEDGEQQVRDGLATLFNTEPDLDLESIADRLGGDGDFDNGDNHLDIDEGLNAVEVGRGYQADDGVLITKEIMGRAVATGGLMAAAALAVLAAILSFLKKNKAAGVFAILAAAAGAFGAFYGPAQGVYFSEIAGSTIGATTWVAAGVLGGVALVHAIVHFATPKTVA